VDSVVVCLVAVAVVAAGNKKYMEDKKAASILIKILDKYSLDAEEKDAVASAIGILSWASLSQSKIKTRKAKREKSSKW
jgi:hypothetical protein